MNPQPTIVKDRRNKGRVRAIIVDDNGRRKGHGEDRGHYKTKMQFMTVHEL